MRDLHKAADASLEKHAASTAIERPERLTLGELEALEKVSAEQHAEYMARHETYIASRRTAVKVFALAREALLQQQACKREE